MKRLPLIIILLLSAVACIYDYPLPVIEGADNALVFDGSIVVGSKAKLNVSRITPTSGSRKSVSVTTWWVEDEDGNVFNVDKTGTADLTTASSDKTYRMVVQCDGKTYSSSFQSPVGAPQIDSLAFFADDYTVYCNLSFGLDTTISKYVALSFEEIWQFHSEFTKMFDVVPFTLEDDTIELRVVELDFADESHYYCWTSRKATAEILVDMSSLGGKAVSYPVNKFSTTNNRNHKEYHMKVVARSLSDTEYRFSHSLLAQEGGLNLFTPNPGAILGNVVCEDNPMEHVYGYVSASASASVEETLDNRYLKPTDPYAELFALSPTDDITWYLDRGYWPIRRIKQGDENPVGWGALRCVDCIAAGGTLEKPDFTE